MDEIWMKGHRRVFRDETEEGFSLENYQPSFTLCRISTKVRVAAPNQMHFENRVFSASKGPKIIRKGQVYFRFRGPIHGSIWNKLQSSLYTTSIMDRQLLRQKLVK